MTDQDNFLTGRLKHFCGNDVRLYFEVRPERRTQSPVCCGDTRDNRSLDTE